MNLAVSQVGLSESDARRLKTILAMAALNSTSLKHKWQFSDADSASLVVVSADSADGLAWMDTHAGEDGKTCAVLAGESDEVPADSIRLPWPIRLEDMLRILRMAEKTALKFKQSKSTTANLSPAKDSHLLRFASVVRDTDNAGSSTAWRIDGVAERSIYVSPGEKVFYYGTSLSSLRQLDSSMQLEFIPVPIEEVHGKPNKKPLEMLQWIVGMQTGAFGLLPWIDSELAMKLRRYPAFHLLHHTPTHRRLAATLSRPRDSVETIAQLASVDPRQACSFINAASLCGYLTQTEKKLPTETKKPGSINKQRSLIKSFRKALGIGFANV